MVSPHTIGLCMILRDEAHVIRRCLDSIRPLVDYVLVVDTGSKDGTQRVVRDWLSDNQIPGTVLEEPWKDFAYNRSHALARLRERVDINYAFIMDADDILVLDEGFNPAKFKATLSADRYYVKLRLGDIWFHRLLLCSNKLPFHFRGVLHEFLDAPPGAGLAGKAAGFHVIAGLEGARNLDPEKYKRDALTLEQALLQEQDPFMRARYTFYLAQSYRDCGDAEQALRHYLDRAEQGYWAEEVFYSLYQAAGLQEHLGNTEVEVLDTYRRATQARATRAEALHGASRFCRRNKLYEEGYNFAQAGVDYARPNFGLFVSDWIYEYGLLDELAVNGYWSGHYKDALEACIVLLADRNIPSSDRLRIRKNAMLTIAKLHDLGRC